MKYIGLIALMVGFVFTLPAQAADESQPQGSQKQIKPPAEEGKATAGKANTGKTPVGKDASGENKKKEDEKQEGGSSEPGCD